MITEIIVHSEFCSHSVSQEYIHINQALCVCVCVGPGSTRAIKVAEVMSSHTHARLIVRRDERPSPPSPHYLTADWDNFIYFMTVLYLEPE